MQVIIIGAGEIGWYLAEILSAEHHDVSVVEFDPGRAANISNHLDVQVVVGSGSSPAVLEQAGIKEASFLAAVTQVDEVNLVAALLAKEHGVGTTVVRIQQEELRGAAGAALIETVGADLVIDPDADTADEILELVHDTGADEVYPMAGGQLVLVGAVVREGASFAGMSLAEIGQAMGPEWDFLFGAITRGGVAIIPRGNVTLEVGDHVRVVSKPSARRQVLDLLGVPGGRAKHVMILGGGSIGSRLAENLQDEGASVVLIERDLARAKVLAEKLPGVAVVQGDINDTELLAQEAVGRMDAVVAATGEDGANVLACAFAASEGSSFTIAVLHRLALLPLVSKFGIDAALSPRTASANSVLRQVRGGTTTVATFLETDAEADEIEIEEGSRADGTKVLNLHLPHSVLIGAVIRPDGEVEIVRGRTVLHAGDHVVVFARPDSLATARGFFTK